MTRGHRCWTYTVSVTAFTFSPLSASPSRAGGSTGFPSPWPSGETASCRAVSSSEGRPRVTHRSMRMTAVLWCHRPPPPLGPAERRAPTRRHTLLPWHTHYAHADRKVAEPQPQDLKDRRRPPDPQDLLSSGVRKRNEDKNRESPAMSVTSAAPCTCPGGTRSHILNSKGF